ncbi:MAG: type II secretion system protein GspD [Pirellulales bacterium]|nr:type II secretion system protein GspD [Pirellulales bacterium]
MLGSYVVFAQQSEEVISTNPPPTAKGQTGPPRPNTVAPQTRSGVSPAASGGRAAKPRQALPATTIKDTEDLAVALERTGDLNLHGLSLNAALFTIGEQWNINIVAGDLQGNVNGSFKQAPLREILDAILLSNGYNYRAVGKSLVISSVNELGQVNPFFQSATIPVQHADIDEVVEGVKLLVTPKGQVRALKSARSIVVLDFPDRIRMIRDFVSTLENAGSGRFPSAENRDGTPMEVGYFRTQHIPAKTAETALSAVMSKEGRVAVLEKEDKLLVTDYAENLTMVEKVLARVDRPRPQVRIVALMYDISLQDLEAIGFNWRPKIKGRIDSNGDAQTQFDVDSVTTVPFGTGAVGNTLTFLNLSRNFDITTVARLVQTAKDARLLADPNVCVSDNEEAVLKKVSEIPYQQLTETQQGGSIGTTAFKEAGITLTVKPKISAEGVIRMEVKPEISRLTGFTPNDNQPIIDTSSAQTTLTVANRQTVVIGGLRNRQDVGEFTGLPYLKDLKVIGRLFRSRDTDVRESELVVFIMPEIISYADEPTYRQKAAAETIGCRLDQIPEAEGCPPCCRRLPMNPIYGCDNCDNPSDTVNPATGPTFVPSTMGGPAIDEPAVGERASAGSAPTQDSFYAPDPNDSNSDSKGNSTEPLPAPPSLELPGPLSAHQIPTAEFQFGVAGRSEHVRSLVANGHLRRLPTVTPIESAFIVSRPKKGGLFTESPISQSSLNAPVDTPVETAIRSSAGPPPR